MADKKLPEPVKMYTSREAAGVLGVTPRTIQLWSESGILQAKKTPGGHRRYTAAAIEALTSEFDKGDSAPKQTSGRLRVLIAEDEPDLRNLYEMTISDWDLPLDMVIVKDGYEALIQFGKTQPHVVILDLNMPRMDGFHMLSVINNFIGSGDTEVIVVTALSKGDITDHGGMPEGVKVFSKPIPFDDIEALLSKRAKALST
jgi:CheY-like chemotaxis protein